MFSHQQSCNEQRAHDQAVVQAMISSEDNLLTMPPVRVNSILVAFNEGRTLEEAARLANEFLGMLGRVRAAFIYSTTVTEESRLNDGTMETILTDESIQINSPSAALSQALATPG